MPEKGVRSILTIPFKTGLGESFIAVMLFIWVSLTPIELGSYPFNVETPVLVGSNQSFKRVVDDVPSQETAKRPKLSLVKPGYQIQIMLNHLEKADH